ncbi:MAG: hypothetical protein V5B36_00840 [Candidatus Accumulibacter sp. UW25]|jgi:hypothetical protein
MERSKWWYYSCPAWSLYKRKQAMNRLLLKTTGCVGTLSSVGLPPYLLVYILTGTLGEEIEKGYKRLEQLNNALDSFEEAHPEFAAQQPWFEERQKWKAAGRPKVFWLDVLPKYATDRKSPKPFYCAKEIKTKKHTTKTPEQSRKHTLAWYYRKKAEKQAQKEEALTLKNN